MDRLIGRITARVRAKLVLSPAPASGLTYLNGWYKKRTTQVSKLETGNWIMYIQE